MKNTKKNLFLRMTTMLMAMVIVFASSVSVLAAITKKFDITILVSGKPLKLEGTEVKGTIVLDDTGERSYGPVKAIAETLGLAVTWDPDTRTTYLNEPGVTLKKVATAKDAKGRIQLYVNNELAMFDGTQVFGIIIEDATGERTYGPLASVVKMLGYKIDWYSSTRTASAYKPTDGLAPEFIGRVFTMYEGAELLFLDGTIAQLLEDDAELFVIKREGDFYIVTLDKTGADKTQYKVDIRECYGLMPLE